MSDAVLRGWQSRAVRRRSGAGPLAVLLGAALAAGLVVAALAMLAAIVPARPQSSRAEPPPAPVWLDIQKPVHVYNLEARALDALPASYAARRLSPGEGREDVLAFGSFAEGAAPAVRLRLFRRGAGAAATDPLFAALAREAAETGMSVARSGLPDLMATRFGTFEVADLVLAGTGTGERSCSGVRLVLADPALTMTGLACGTSTRPLTREALGCLVERLDVASARDDAALIDFFAVTELKRNPACAGMRLGPDEVHAAWLDDKPATARKSLRRH